MKKFFLKIVTLIWLVVSIVLGINYVYVLFDKTDPDWVKKFNKIPQNIQVCNFGSSHGLYGFDYSELDNRNRCFNFALVSQSLDYDFAIMKQYEDKIAPGTIVYLVVSYFSLYGYDESLASDFDAKNRRYYKFLEPRYIKKYEPIKDFLITKIPIILEPQNIRKLISGKLSTNNNCAQWNTVSSNIDLAKDVKAAAKRHIVSEKRDKFGKIIINEDAVNILREMIMLCHNKGAIPILVTTPYLQEYVNEIDKTDRTFRKEFHVLIHELATKCSVGYYDYATDIRFSKSYDLFMNGDHLNQNGAKKFIRILLSDTLKSVG